MKPIILVLGVVALINTGVFANDLDFTGDGPSSNGDALLTKIEFKGVDQNGDFCSVSGNGERVEVTFMGEFLQVADRPARPMETTNTLYLSKDSVDNVWNKLRRLKLNQGSVYNKLRSDSPVFLGRVDHLKHTITLNQQGEEVRGFEYQVLTTIKQHGIFANYDVVGDLFPRTLYKYEKTISCGP